MIYKNLWTVLWRKISEVDLKTCLGHISEGRENEVLWCFYWNIWIFYILFTAVNLFKEDELTFENVRYEEHHHKYYDSEEEKERKEKEKK